MATTDIRFKRMNDEYQSLRTAQDELFEKGGYFEAIIRHFDILYKFDASGIGQNEKWIMEVTLTVFLQSTMAISTGR